MGHVQLRGPVASALRPLTHAWSALAVAVGLALLVVLAVVVGPVAALTVGVTLVLFFTFRANGDVVSLLAVLTIALLLTPARLRIVPLHALGTPAALVGLAAFLVWAYGRLFGLSWIARGRQPVLWALCLVAGSVLSSYVAMGYRPHEMIESKAADRGILTLLSMIGFAMLAADTISRRSQIRRILKVVALCGAAISLVGIAQFATGIDLGSYVRLPGFTFLPSGYAGERSGFNRIVSTTSHPIELSVVLALTLCASLYLWRTASDTGKLRWALISTVIGVSIPLTVSRTAIVSLVAVLVFLVPTWDRRARRRLYLVLAVGIGLMRIAVPGLLGTLRSFFFLNSSTDPSIQSRTVGFGAAADLITAHPILGRGFGTFVPELYFYLDNQMLLTVVETGVVGVLAIIGLYGTGAWLTREVRRMSPREDDRALAQCLLAAIVVGFLSSFTYDAFSFPTARTLLMLMLGIAGALWRIVSRERAAGPPELSVAQGNESGTRART